MHRLGHDRDAAYDGAECLVISCSTQHPVQVLLWDVASGKTVHSYPAPHAVRALAFSPDGKLAAVACQKTISLLTVPAK